MRTVELLTYGELSKRFASYRTELIETVHDKEPVIITEVMDIHHTIVMVENARYTGVLISDNVWSMCFDCDDWGMDEKTSPEQWQKLRTLFVENLKQQTPKGYVFVEGETIFAYEPAK